MYTYNNQSHNRFNAAKVDEAAAIIRGYLAHPSCSLQTLCLRSADVDDNECCDLMEAIKRNRSLTRLDVSGKACLSRFIDE